MITEYSVDRIRCFPYSGKAGPNLGAEKLMTVLDLAVTGGTVVTPDGTRVADLEISEGKIVGIVAEAAPARERFDAEGLLVFPGMVEAHAHFMDPADPERESFPEGSAAGAAAGVTTVIEHTHAAPVVSAEDLRRKADYLADRSHIDFGLAAHAMPDRLDEIPAVWEAGVAFIKAFTCTTHGVPGFDADHLGRLLEIASGIDAVCMLHCEDEQLTEVAERALRASGREDGSIVPEWRNPEAEIEALSTAERLAVSTGARTVFAHVSSARAIETLLAGKASARIAIETCPQYLTLLEEEVLTADAAQYAQSGHGVRGEFGGPARLGALVGGPLGGAGQQGQYGQGQHRQAERDDEAERRFVDDESAADQHDGQGRRGEAGDGLHEPADLLDVARGDGDDLTGGDAAGQGRAEQRGPAGEELLDAARGGDPVGDGGAVQEGVAQRVARAAQQHQAAREGEPGAGAVDDGLDGEAHTERQGGDGGEVQEPPGERLELAAKLVAEEPPQQSGARACVGHARVGIRKVLDLHEVPAARFRRCRATRRQQGANRKRFASARARNQANIPRMARGSGWRPSPRHGGDVATRHPSYAVVGPRAARHTGRKRPTAGPGRP